MAAKNMATRRSRCEIRVARPIDPTIMKENHT